MTPFRIASLLALAGSVSVTAYAAPPGTTIVPQPESLDLGQPGSEPVGNSSIFASGAIPIGDPRWSLRGFTLVGEMVDSPAAESVEETPSPTPEPAGLFLLGTGAFATALSIRYRLFTL